MSGINSHEGSTWKHECVKIWCQLNAGVSIAFYCSLRSLSITHSGHSTKNAQTCSLGIYITVSQWMGISWVDHVRNEEVLLRVNEQRNILREIRKRKANWIGHILRRNYLLKQVIEGKIKGEMEVTRRRGRRRKKLLDDLKDRRGYSHLKEAAVDRNMWRDHFGRGFGPVARQTAYWIR